MMPPPPPPPQQQPQPNSVPVDAEEGRPPSPVVKENLKDVQLKLQALEYTLRSLSAIAADVQPPGPSDHPQGTPYT